MSYWIVGNLLDYIEKFASQMEIMTQNIYISCPGGSPIRRLFPKTNYLVPLKEILTLYQAFL